MSDSMKVGNTLTAVWNKQAQALAPKLPVVVQSLPSFASELGLEAKPNSPKSPLADDTTISEAIDSIISTAIKKNQKLNVETLFQEAWKYRLKKQATSRWLEEKVGDLIHVRGLLSLEVSLPKSEVERTRQEFFQELFIYCNNQGSSACYHDGAAQQQLREHLQSLNTAIDGCKRTLSREKTEDYDHAPNALTENDLKYLEQIFLEQLKQENKINLNQAIETVQAWLKHDTKVICWSAFLPILEQKLKDKGNTNKYNLPQEISRIKRFLKRKESASNLYIFQEAFHQNLELNKKIQEIFTKQLKNRQIHLDNATTEIQTWLLDDERRTYRNAREIAEQCSELAYLKYAFKPILEKLAEKANHSLTLGRKTAICEQLQAELQRKVVQQPPKSNSDKQQECREILKVITQYQMGLNQDLCKLANIKNKDSEQNKEMREIESKFILSMHALNDFYTKQQPAMLKGLFDINPNLGWLDLGGEKLKYQPSPSEMILRHELAKHGKSSLRDVVGELNIQNLKPLELLAKLSNNFNHQTATKIPSHIAHWIAVYPNAVASWKVNLQHLSSLFSAREHTAENEQKNSIIDLLHEISGDLEQRVETKLMLKHITHGVIGDEQLPAIPLPVIVLLHTAQFVKLNQIAQYTVIQGGSETFVERTGTFINAVLEIITPAAPRLLRTVKSLGKVMKPVAKKAAQYRIASVIVTWNEYMAEQLSQSDMLNIEDLYTLKAFSRAFYSLKVGKLPDLKDTLFKLNGKMAELDILKTAYQTCLGEIGEEALKIRNELFEKHQPRWLKWVTRTLTRLPEFTVLVLGSSLLVGVLGLSWLLSVPALCTGLYFAQRNKTLSKAKQIYENYIQSTAESRLRLAASVGLNREAQKNIDADLKNREHDTFKQRLIKLLQEQKSSQYAQEYAKKLQENLADVDPQKDIDNMEKKIKSSTQTICDKAGIGSDVASDKRFTIADSLIKAVTAAEAV